MWRLRCVATKSCGADVRATSCNREDFGSMEGNSFGLVATLRLRCGRRQLLQPLGSSLAREPCMDETHVVGKKLRPKVYYPCYATLAMREKGSLLRELARAAGARLRELPSAAAQQDEETNIAVRGSCPPPQRNCCVAAKSRGTDVRGSHPATEKSPVRVEGNSFSLSAAPSRGSRVRKNPCSREIFSADRFYLHALSRQYDPQAPSRGSWRRSA